MSDYNNIKELYFDEDDLMDRERYANNLKTIINECKDYPRSNDNLSYVIGIDAPWGTGKTYFVNMLANLLKGYRSKASASGELSENVKEVIYYDSWKNDFWDNAFEPLFDKLIQANSIYPETEKEDIKGILKTSAKIISLGLKGYLNKKIEDNFDTGVIDDITDEVKSLLSNGFNKDYQTEKIFPEYSAFCDAILKLQEYLKKSIEQRGEIVIIIDELDRCRPTFAVQTLEIVKHLFNIEGLVFVFSLDISQLSHCVKTVYGERFNAIGYLERFFNYLTMLPRGRNKKMVQSCFSEFKINVCNEQEEESYEKIFDYFHLSLREIRIVMSSFFVLNKTSLIDYNNITNAKILYLYFLTMKYKFPEMFANAVFSGSMKEFNDFLLSNPIPFLCSVENKIDWKVICSDLEHNVYINGMFSVVISQEGIIHNKKIESIIRNKVIFDGGNEIDVEDIDTISYLIYQPDIRKFEQIKKYSVLEYIYRQIELCDFGSELMC